MHPLVEAELAGRSALDPAVPFRARADHTHATWARTFSCLPELYIQPESVAEIHKALRLARLARRRVVVTGCGHSPSAITCSSAWMLNLDRFNRVLSVDTEEDDSGEKEYTVTVEAGIRLFQLCDALDRHGLALANLGSINEQSIAGAIATGTHGSSLRHGLLSADVRALRIALADGRELACSPTAEPDLFRAALLSLGALGVLTQVRLRVVPAFALRWRQTIDADAALLAAWPTGHLWEAHDFVRVWWFPYTRRAVVWHADRTTNITSDDDNPEPPPARSWYDRRLGYHVYRALLLAAHWCPRILPFVEWFVFGMQYGFADGSASAAVQPARDALLMNCLYPQFVNEWALPLHRGPEALRRLASWLHRLRPDHPDYLPHRIPFSADGLWVHAPLEVRVSDTSSGDPSARPFLDPTVPDGPTLYLNATLYRPFWRDPPCRHRYYQAFEWLMRDMGGRPHWAKNFAADRALLEPMYGDALDRFRKVRDAVDPQGMFLGPWHREKILAEHAVYDLEETEAYREKSPQGITVYGALKEPEPELS